MASISEAHIVRWALPKENIPLRVTWPETEQVDAARVILAEDLGLIDVLNIDEVKIEGNVVTVKPKRPILGTPNYFGVIVSLSKLYNDLKVFKKIVIELLSESQVVDRRELYARIFRPSLEVVRFPEVIELEDGQKTTTLPLHIKYVGFGDIQMKIESVIGGRIVSEGESIIYEIIRRLWLSDVLEDTPIPKEEGKERKKEFWISPEYVRQMTEKLQDMIETGTIPTEEINKESIEQFKLWLSNIRTREKLTEIVYSRVEDILLSLLVDLLERHPTDSVRLSDARTSIRTKIEAPIENLTLRLRYRDLMENEYLPVEVVIKIIDKRKKESGFLINIPITIQKWEDEPFLNVRDMKMMEE